MAIIKIGQKLVRKALTEPFKADLQLALHDPRVLLLLRLRTQSLPGQFSPEKVDKNVAERLQIVSSTLLHSQVVVERSIARSSRQTLVLTISIHELPSTQSRNVLPSHHVPVGLAQAIVDKKNHIRLFVQTHSKVIRFDVSVDQVFTMHIF